MAGVGLDDRAADLDAARPGRPAAWPAKGSIPAPPAHQMLVNPSSSACTAWSMRRSTVAPPPLMPMRKVTAAQPRTCGGRPSLASPRWKPRSWDAAGAGRRRPGRQAAAAAAATAADPGARLPPLLAAQLAGPGGAGVLTSRGRSPPSSRAGATSGCTPPPSPPAAWHEAPGTLALADVGCATAGSPPG